MIRSNDIFLVVMAGGSGTRFWPKSTSKRPKQLLSFSVPGSSQRPTLLTQTLSRFDGLVSSTNRLIVTTRALTSAVRQDSPRVEILSEPQGRNTAPCIYWAAREVAKRSPRAVMLVMPSDHAIRQGDKFSSTVSAAVEWALTHDDLIALGVKPHQPETGYGYLKIGRSLGKGAARVEAFVEKPNLKKAKEFLKKGNYLWNGGMFVWRADVILAAFDELMPEMKKAWDKADGDVETAYPQMTATSIDYGVMEKAENVVSFKLNCGWDDLGSWTSLESIADTIDARRDGSVVMDGELLSVESKGNIVDVKGKLVALLGIENLIIVEQGDTILIARKDLAQDIRKVVEQVKKQRPELA